MLLELTEQALCELQTLLLALLLGFYLLVVAELDYNTYMIFISSYLTVYSSVVIFSPWHIKKTPDGTFIRFRAQVRIPNIQLLRPQDDTLVRAFGALHSRKVILKKPQ